MSNTIELTSDKKESKKVDFGKVDTSDYKKPEITKESIDEKLGEYSQAATVTNDENTDNKTIDFSSKNPALTSLGTGKRKRKTKAEKEAEKKVISGEIISGALALTIIDMLLPLAFASINNVIDKKHKVKGGAIKMTASQLNELSPIANEVMKEIQMKASPIAILIGSMISIYSMNFLQAKYSVDNG